MFVRFASLLNITNRLAISPKKKFVNISCTLKRQEMGQNRQPRGILYPTGPVLLLFSVSSSFARTPYINKIINRIIMDLIQGFFASEPIISTPNGTVSGVFQPLSCQTKPLGTMCNRNRRINSFVELRGGHMTLFRISNLTT